MTLPYRLTESASADLDDAWHYIAESSPQSADEQVTRIVERIKRLARYPRSGRMRDDIGSGIRSAVVDNFLIIYCVAPDQLQVTRIVHGARDLESLMRDGA